MQQTLTELLNTRRRLERAADALTRIIRQAGEALDETRGLPVAPKVEDLRDRATELRSELTREAMALSGRIEATVPAAQDDECGDALGVAERPPQWQMV